MKFLPIFLDPSAGPILLVGAGDPVRARLRLLLAAGAHVRWHATDGDFAVPGLETATASRIERAEADPRVVDLSGIIAVFCASAGEIGERVAARARSAGVPVNVMDDPAHSSFIVPAIVDRGDVVAAIGTGGASPVVARRVRERIEAALPARIGHLAAMIGRWRRSIHDHIPDLPLRRRFWERVIDGPIGEAVLAGRSDEAEGSLKAIVDPSIYAGASVPGESKGASRWSVRGRAIRICSPSRRCGRCRMPTSYFTTNWSRQRFSIARAATRCVCRWVAVSANPASGKTPSTGC